MTSAFWGGFAGSLKEGLDKDKEEKRRGREAELAEQLKAKYEARLVDSTQTTYEGNVEVRRNRFGDVLSRRELSPEEAADRKAARDALAAETEEKVAKAGVAKKGLENYDADRQLEIDDKAFSRSAEERRLGLTARGLDLQEARLDKSEEDAPIALLYEADGMGDSSAVALAENYQMRLSQAKTPAERKAIVAEYTGVARQLLAKLRQDRAVELKNAGSGLPPPAP